MANEWKVTEYSQTETDTESNGDKTVYTTSLTETTATMTTEDTPNGGSTTTTTQTGTVNMNEMTIDKDGTWTSTRDITTTDVVFGVNTTTKVTMTASGTWAFVGKTKGDDFKKNERVMFNTLSESTTSVYTAGSTTQTSSSSDTYMTGENVMVYTVKESKKDELQLEAEIGNTYTSGSNTSTTKGKTTITLAGK
ncbi:hypothetical protein [Fluviicola chungangensis]|nr:hypothetical protein [Fluviicola chungangensis]